MRGRLRAPLLLSLIIIILSSCNRGVLYQKYTTIPDNVWDYKSPITFKADVHDTLGLYNIFVNVRNADGYPYSNLYLFIDINTPMHTYTRDTLMCILADPSGKWLGEGLGDLWDNKILYKRNVHFPKSGEYDFTYTQAMREDKLQLIVDVGLTIEKVKNDR